MGLTVDSWFAVDLALLGTAGAAAAFAALGAWYTVPWRRRSRHAESTREFNVLWKGRAALAVLCALWAACQVLPLSAIWGPNSFIFPSLVTDWTGAGWLCRIYLTTALGIFQPLCSLMTLFMLAAVVSPKPPRPGGSSSGAAASALCFGRKAESRGQLLGVGSEPSEGLAKAPPARRPNPNRRLLGLALLATAPVAAAQGVAAWLSLVLRTGGERPEQQPHSVLGYFFAAFWYGDQRQCGGSEGCALCVFPAAAVAVHVAFSLAFLVALWVTSSRLAAAVLNRRLKRRMRFFQWAQTLLVATGAGAIGGSIGQTPFGWVYEGCWIGYVATVVAGVVLVVWEVVMWPARDLSRMNKSLKLWMDPCEGLGESEGEGGLIKAVPPGGRALAERAAAPAPAASGFGPLDAAPMADAPPTALRS